QCPERLLDNDYRGRIFMYDPAINRIELVYMSPTVRALQSDGTIINVPRDVGYRTMEVFREADGTEALYVGTFNSRQFPAPPARILRTTDGRNFTEIETPFSNDPGFTAFRSLTTYKNRLYVCVIGQETDDSVLLEASDPRSGNFRVIHTPGLGDPTNDTPYALKEFKGFLYVGTGNSTKGFQLLKTQAAGSPPYFFQPVLVDGAYRGPNNENVVSLGVYKDYLYVGSGILFGGYDFLRNVGPAPAELLRVKADDSWEIVCGLERDTPDGHKAPITGLGPGFGNNFTGYMWRMAEYNGVFYLSTFDNAYIAQYFQDVSLDELEAFFGDLDLGNIPVDPATVSADELADIISAVEGGFDLWATTNGEQWRRVTRAGLGDLFDYGGRSLEPTSYGLYVGTADPFFGFRLFLGQSTGTDTDGDGIADASDNCPMNPNGSQSDADDDGLGDVCDDDLDNDCIPDQFDTDPTTPGPDDDTDGDGILDRCDMDDDGDGVPDFQDNCSKTANFNQVDQDGDGQGDACRPEDSDGVPRAIENDAPNGGDANGDGIPDGDQNHVASLRLASGDFLTLVAPDGTELTTVLSMGNPSPADAPAGVSFPVGFFGLNVTGLPPGGGVTLQMTLPVGTSINTYWRYGPTPDDPAPHWYEFDFDGTTGAQARDNFVTIAFVDGARGDDDLAANGVIVDPGAPALGPTPTANPRPRGLLGLLSLLCGMGVITAMPLTALGVLGMKRRVRRRMKK
ncbi:MAG: choice-of-anchor U domain-containing protein, partial [Phycisphaerae bacterium]